MLLMDSGRCWARYRLACMPPPRVTLSRRRGVPGTEQKGAIRWHEALIWIHGPGMVLTPILGAMALSQQDNGQKVHGIAAAHSAVAVTTFAAYGASIVAVSWPIHVKFWEHQ